MRRSLAPHPILGILVALVVSLGALGAPGPVTATPRAPHNGSRPPLPDFPCGGELGGDWGFVASEGFPRPYPPHSNCTWTITVPEGLQVALSFRVFDLEPDPRCRFDSLWVLGGGGEGGSPGSDGAEGGPLLGRFCGTFRPGPLVAPGNRLRLRLESDGGRSGRGFLAVFSAKRPPRGDEPHLCGGLLEQPKGTLRTPNWPEENYPPGISCSWQILAPPGKVVELTFEKLDLEPDPHCRFDFVAVFEGTGGPEPPRRLGKFCGEEPPRPIMSSGRQLLVQFVSDLSVTGDGFAASYSLQDPHPNPGWALATPATAPLASTPLATTTPPALACPQRCRRRGGTLQSNFCSSDLVLTGTVKSVSRGTPQGGGDWVVVSILSLFKSVVELGLPPSPAKGATLRLQLPCGGCPALKKGSSYLLMGQTGGAGRGALLPPDAFVLPHRPQQQQVLTTLSQRPCRGRNP